MGYSIRELHSNILRVQGRTMRGLQLDRSWHGGSGRVTTPGLSLITSRLNSRTTCKSFCTDLTPSIPLAIFSAVFFVSSELTLPWILTKPSVLSTLISLPITRASVNRAIFVLVVSQISLSAGCLFTSASPFAHPVTTTPPDNQRPAYDQSSPYIHDRFFPRPRERLECRS